MTFQVTSFSNFSSFCIYIYIILEHAFTWLQKSSIKISIKNLHISDMKQRVYIQSNIIPVRNNIVSVMQRFLKSQLLSFITREISQTCSTKKSHSFKRMNYITRHNSLNKLLVPFCLSWRVLQSSRFGCVCWCEEGNKTKYFWDYFW